jgi:phospholipid N-methyltransferase
MPTQWIANKPENGAPRIKPSRSPRHGEAERSPRSGVSGLHARLHFLGAFVREPWTVGAFWPSSAVLSRRVVENCDIAPGDTVVELGPGTGAFTRLILKRLRGHGRFLAVEINRTNSAVLRRRFPDCEVINDSAEHLSRYVGRRRANCIISGLAWGNMFARTQNRILAAVLKSLAPGGQLVAFAYVHAVWYPTSLRFRRSLFERFDRVETTSIIWRNLPPAFIYRCWRG